MFSRALSRLGRDAGRFLTSEMSPAQRQMASFSHCQDNAARRQDTNAAGSVDGSKEDKEVTKKNTAEDITKQWEELKVDKEVTKKNTAEDIKEAVAAGPQGHTARASPDRPPLPDHVWSSMPRRFKQMSERTWRRNTPIEVNIIEETEKTWERWVKNQGWDPRWTSEQVHIFNRTREPWSEEPGRQGKWGWTRTGKWQRSEEP